MPCERGFSAQNRIHGALRNKMSPSADECKMYISYASKNHVDEESVCDRAVKKFYEMKKRRKQNCRITLDCDLICMSQFLV